MGFNYGKERKRMEDSFSKLSELYREEGVDQEMINIVHEMWMEELRSNRKFWMKAQSLYAGFDGDDRNIDDTVSPLLYGNMEQMSFVEAEIEEVLFESEWFFAGELRFTDERIGSWLARLGETDYQIVECLLDGLNQGEIGEMLGCSQQAVSRRIGKLRGSLGMVMGRQGE